MVSFLSAPVLLGRLGVVLFVLIFGIVGMARLVARHPRRTTGWRRRWIVLASDLANVEPAEWLEGPTVGLGVVPPPC